MYRMYYKFCIKSVKAKKYKQQNNIKPKVNPNSCGRNRIEKEENNI